MSYLAGGMWASWAITESWKGSVALRTSFKYFSAAWRVSGEGEAARHAERRFALVAWGLTSMDQMLGHHRLRRKAVALRMPRELALATLASHRWPRSG